MRGPRITCVATYERVLPVSVERIWENVLDWEHLPGLHRDSFASIRRIDSGDWGWTAYVRGRGGDARELTIQVVIERENLRYVTATIDGPGKGTEIWTTLEDKGEHETHIKVEFLVPNVSPERVTTLGEAYRTLYARLWDEDEAMMVRREKWLAAQKTRAPHGERRVLGALDDVRAKLPLVVELGGRPWRVVALGDELLAHAALCPHWLGPLEDAPLEGDTIECPWHRYRFDVRSGKSCDGRGLRLMPAPRVTIDASRIVSLVAD